MRYVSAALSMTFFTFLFIVSSLEARPLPTPAVLTFTESPSYTYSATPVGATSHHTFQVTNSGEARATLMAATASGASFIFKGGNYPGTGGNCGISLAGNYRTCKIVVSFAPMVAGISSGNITLNYRDGYTTQSVSQTVSGTGLSVASLAFSDVSPYAFGNVPSGTSASHTFTVTNGGETAATRLSSASIGAKYSFPGGYPGTGGTCGTSLDANNASCTVVVTFSPTSTAATTGTLNLNYFNGAANTNVTISLTGKGTGSTPSVTNLTPAVGPASGSTSVTLTGSSFSAPATVSFGGSPCGTVVVLSATQIQCTTSAHAPGTVDVEVTTGGTTTTLYGAFTYQPPPTVTSIDTSLGVTSGGGTLSITGSDFNATPTVSVGGADCAGVSFTNSTFIQCTIPAHTSGLVSVVVTNPDGQSSTLSNAFTYVGAWTWKSGSSTIREWTGVNPGARDSASYWTDSAGNFWLFGGWGADSTGKTGALSDLWKYNGASWTLVVGTTQANQPGVYGSLGVANALNRPGARTNGHTWIDGSNNLWLFGGWGYDANQAAGFLNDLWKFDGIDWTWMSGSKLRNPLPSYGTFGITSGTNMPGPRIVGVQWIDTTGNLWLFGGYGTDSAALQGDLNDLWVFDGANWTWMSGSDLRLQSGTYGTMGIPAGANTPGARESAMAWKDASGNFWLFGGTGRDSTGTSGILNDLWMYDGTNWTWVSGSNTVGQPSNYGAQRVPAASNMPGARNGAVVKMDASNNLWLMGGHGIDASGFAGALNDLWKFDGVSWTWISGEQQADLPGLYGTQGVASLSNSPGSRQNAAIWIDASNRVWIFGGAGFDAIGNAGQLSDLWFFQP